MTNYYSHNCDTSPRYHHTSHIFPKNIVFDWALQSSI